MAVRRANHYTKQVVIDTVCDSEFIKNFRSSEIIIPQLVSYTGLGRGMTCDETPLLNVSE